MIWTITLMLRHRLGGWIDQAPVSVKRVVEHHPDAARELYAALGREIAAQDKRKNAARQGRLWDRGNGWSS